MPFELPQCTKRDCSDRAVEKDEINRPFMSGQAKIPNAEFVPTAMGVVSPTITKRRLRWERRCTIFVVKGKAAPENAVSK
jgi:hypothetical protein